MAKRVRSRKSGSGFWGLIDKAAEIGKRERPCFSNAWISDNEIGESSDTRENQYLRTEILTDKEASMRMYFALPTEFTLEREEIIEITDSIVALRKAAPPQAVLDDESRLQRYTERQIMRSLTGKGRLSDPERTRILSRIGAQYSSGYGVLEHLLRDERVQDIYVDPPVDERPVYVNLGGDLDPELQGTMPTNIYLTEEEVERLVSILRYHSGRPFSEANPVLECDLGLYKSRTTAVSPPMSPLGTSLAIRRHSHDPWTLLRLLEKKTLTPLCAGFLNLAIDGRCTMLIAGPRGAGKSSLLGALLFEVGRGQRIIVIEDTPELPLKQLSECGYKVLGLTVGVGEKATPENALRTALRLGESVLVMGEVRGPETRILYDAMSAGTAGSAVMGTFHADSAEAVYKRAVDDLGVPPGSFNATDIVVVTGLVRPKGRRVTLRRVVQVAELVKDGSPGEFRDLFLYDPASDRLRGTKVLRSSSVIGRISKTWGMEPEEVLEEMEARGSMMRAALDEVSRSDLIKGRTQAAVLDTIRNIRDSAAQNGWLSDKKRIVDEFTGLFGEEVV